MKLVGRVDLKTTELPDALEFTVEREYGWFEIFVCLAITLFALWTFWRVKTAITHLFVVAISAVFVVSIVAHRVQGSTAKLRVTSHELFAEGNLNRLFKTKLRIPCRDIKSLKYRLEDEGPSGGIYVKHQGTRTCVLTGLNEDQGTYVINAIYEKFPALCPEDASPASFLYGTESGLTVLGLSDTDPEQKNSNQ